MKKVLLFLLIALPVYLTPSLYYMDKEYFLYPIKYKGCVIIRNDSRGDGVFAAERNGRRLHKGIDLAAMLEAPVASARPGRVIQATQNNGMGKYVIIQHADNISTLYGHLSRIYVAKDEFVQQGEVIGTVGKTGNASHPDIQPHLHFEVRYSGTAQDPLEYLE